MRFDSKSNILFSVRHPEPRWVGKMSRMRNAYAELEGFPLESDRYCSQPNFCDDGENRHGPLRAY